MTLRSAAIFTAFGAVVLTQALWWRGLMHYTDTQPLTTAFLGIPLHYMLDVRDELIKYKDVVIVTDDYWTMYDQEPGAWVVMLRRSADCVRAIGGNNFAVFPQAPFAVLITPRAPQNPVNGLYTTDSPKIYPLRPGDGQYVIHHFDQAPEWSGPPLISVTPARFDNGAVLTGYRLEPGLMFLEWAITRPQSENFQYFGHFLDASGERVGQRDGSFLPGRSWCEGDRLITWIDTNVPEGVTTLRVGMYFLGQGSSAGQVYPSNILDDANSFTGQWVDIPLETQAP